MNKCGCNKKQKAGELWMQGLCKSCGSVMGVCSWNCSLEICQNCRRDLRISKVFDLGEIVKNS